MGDDSGRQYSPKGNSPCLLHTHRYAEMFLRPSSHAAFSAPSDFLLSLCRPMSYSFTCSARAERNLKLRIETSPTKLSWLNRLACVYLWASDMVRSTQAFTGSRPGLEIRPRLYDLSIWANQVFFARHESIEQYGVAGHWSNLKPKQDRYGRDCQRLPSHPAGTAMMYP
jgi:hypothetical protein